MEIIKTTVKSLIGKEETIVKSYQTGDSISKIAEDVGSTRRSVSKLLKDNNIDKHTSKIDSVRDHRDKIIKDYVNGKSITDIAKENGWKRHLVDIVVNESGVEKRTAKEVVNNDSYTRGAKKVKGDDLQKCVEMYLSGMTFADIGEEMGCSSVTIRNKLLKEGVELRTATENAGNAKIARSKTNLAKYGVENPMQDPDIFEKSNTTRFKYKELVYEGRKFEKLQGYEPQSIVYMVEDMGIDLDLITNNPPIVDYSMMNKKKKYYPDLWIEQDNILVEVKCEYTYEADLEKNIEKQQASLRQGYNHMTIIFDNTGKNVTEIIKKFC